MSGNEFANLKKGAIELQMKEWRLFGARMRKSTRRTTKSKNETRSGVSFTRSSYIRQQICNARTPPSVRSNKGSKGELQDLLVDLDRS